MLKIKSPAEGYYGRSTFGPYQMEFVDGEAQVPSLNEGLLAWLKDHGYKVSGTPEKGAEDPGRAVGYDPADHTVDEVLEHAGKLGPAAVAQLAEQEQANKNRKSLLEALARLQHPAAAEDLIGDTE